MVEVNVPITEKQAKYLVEIAEQEGVSTASVMRNALELLIRHWNRQSTYSHEEQEERTITIETLAMWENEKTQDIDIAVVAQTDAGPQEKPESLG